MGAQKLGKSKSFYHMRTSPNPKCMITTFHTHSWHTPSAWFRLGNFFLLVYERALYTHRIKG
jgi:hypothetical protein